MARVYVSRKLQRVLNVAARVITGTWKFDSGLSHILHHDLHWLDVPQRVIFKLCMTVLMSARLSTEVPRRVVRSGCGCCRSPSRSASQKLFNFPRYNVSNYGRRAFCFAGLELAS